MAKLKATDFDLGSGLFEGPGKVTEVCFGPNPNADYQSQSKAPGLTLTVESPEREEPIDIWYSIGDGWEAKRGGKEVVNKNKPDSKRFNMNSKGGKLLQGMFKVVGNGDVDKGKELLAERGHPMTTAECYEGWDFEWVQMAVAYSIDGKDISGTIAIPVELLGSPDEKTKGKVKAKVEPVEEATELDDIVVGLAEGKTVRELKGACMKEDTLKADDDYMTSVVSGDKIQELIDDGKLTTGPDGRFI